MSHDSTSDIATLCGVHLAEEERLLTSALPIVHAVQQQFTRREPGPLPGIDELHQELTQLIGAVQLRRQSLRAAIARRFNITAEDVRLSQIVDELPSASREALTVQMARVRKLADVLVASNHRLSLQLRIYLDGYQRLLRDLTGTAMGSGRYGPHGKADVAEYRSLIQVQG
jgi:hypothetical protein